MLLNDAIPNVLIRRIYEVPRLRVVVTKSEWDYQPTRPCSGDELHGNDLELDSYRNRSILFFTSLCEVLGLLSFELDPLYTTHFLFSFVKNGEMDKL